MNSSYLGNSADLLKWDLITHIINGSDGLGFFYVPMLTEPLPKKRNPKYETFEIGILNKSLFKLMKREYLKEYSNIEVIKKYFIDSGIHLSMLNPIQQKKLMYFTEESRKDYFSEAIKHHKSLVNPTLVYLDPDVGCDIGITRRFRSNKSRYVKRHEVVSFQQNLRKGEILSYFQHLGDGRQPISERIKSLNAAFGDNVLFVAYTRIQAGFVFIFHDDYTYRDKRNLIEYYIRQYDYLKHKDKFIIQGKPLKSSGFLF